MNPRRRLGALAAAAFVGGVLLALAGVAIIYPPAAVILGGLALAAIGLEELLR